MCLDSFHGSWPGWIAEIETKGSGTDPISANYKFLTIKLLTFLKQSFTKEREGIKFRDKRMDERKDE